MLADAVYDALRPFHLWAQVAAICAVVLAGAAVAVLAPSRRWSRRWWVGLGVLTLCPLTVAFGERSRGAASYLRSIAECYTRWVSGCEAWVPWLTVAAGRAVLLGAAVVVATGICMVAAAAVLFAERRRLAHRGWRPPAHALALALTMPLAALGAYLTADGVAAWIRYSYLADITRVGDGLGQLPLFEAIAGTVVGLLVLAAGLTFVVVATPRGHIQEIAVHDAR